MLIIIESNFSRKLGLCPGAISIDAKLAASIVLRLMETSRVAKLFAEILEIPVESITDETSPENTPQWDSLQAMNLVVALEGAFNVRLSTKEIVSMRTVGLVRKVLRGKGAADV